MLEEIKKLLKSKRGQVGSSIDALITLFMGLGVVVLVIILVSVIGGKTYVITQNDIATITDDGIRSDVNGAIAASFDSLNTTAGFLPLVALAVVMFLVLSLILGSVGGARGGYGGAF